MDYLKKIFNFLLLELISYVYIINAYRLSNILTKNKKINEFKLNYLEIKKTEYNLSICIPTFARKEKAKYLDFAINRLDKAIKFSSLKDYEILIFDNCSEYDLNYLITKFKDLNIKIINSGKKLELHDSWYSSANYSSGKYIYIHSDDDFVDKKFFEDIKKNLNNYYDFMICRTKSIWDVEYDKTEFNWTWAIPNSTSSCEFIPSDKFIYFPVASSCMIFKRDFFEKYGVIPSIEHGVDLDLCFRVRKYVKRAYFCFNSINYYRMHPYQSSRDSREDPQDIERLEWMLKKSNIIYKYFDSKDAKKFSLLYMMIYALILDGQGRLNNKIDSGSTYIDLKNWGKMQFGIFWNKYFFLLYKNKIRFMDQFKIINKILKKFN